MYQKRDNNYKTYKDIAGDDTETKQEEGQEEQSPVIEFADLTQKQYYITNAPLLVIDYYTTWCGPCKVVAPKYKQLALEHRDVVFAKENIELGMTQGIGGVPTFHIYVLGNKVWEFTGADASQINKTLHEIKTSHSRKSQ